MAKKSLSFSNLISSNRQSFTQNRNGIKDIISSSTRAVCGTFEREVIVSKSKVNSTKARLKSEGFIIVGTGPAGANSTKIWFNPAGANL